MLNAISTKIKNYTCSRVISKSRHTLAKFYRNTVKTEHTNNKGVLRVLTAVTKNEGKTALTAKSNKSIPKIATK